VLGLEALAEVVTLEHLETVKWAVRRMVPS